MSIEKQADGRWLVDCRPEGRSGPRIRRKFRTKNEAQVFFNRTMGDGAKGEFEKKPKLDERRLSELIERWYTLHGQNLATGDQTLTAAVLDLTDSQTRAAHLTLGLPGERGARERR